MAYQVTPVKQKAGGFVWKETGHELDLVGWRSYSEDSHLWGQPLYITRIQNSQPFSIAEVFSLVEQWK